MQWVFRLCRYIGGFRTEVDHVLPTCERDKVLDPVHACGIFATVMNVFLAGDRPRKAGNSETFARL
jgi:hypothetical protein